MRGGFLTRVLEAYGLDRLVYLEYAWPPQEVGACPMRDSLSSPVAFNMHGFLDLGIGRAQSADHIMADMSCQALGVFIWRSIVVDLGFF